MSAQQVQAAPNTDESLYGIDISKWQAGIDVSKVPCSFVIVKATQGTTYTNEYLQGMVADTLRAGKLLGLYHFATATDSPEDQADHFVNCPQVRDNIGRAVLVLDWEAGAVAKGPLFAKRFLDRVRATTGVKPMIYMSASPTTAYDWSSVVAAGYPLWVAWPRDGVPPVGHWNTFAMWQFTSTGRLQGWDGNLDRDRFYGNRDTWLRYADAADDRTTTSTQSTSTPTAPTTPTTPTTEEITADMKATHIIFENAGRTGIANVLAGTYRFVPDAKALADSRMVLTRSGAKVVEWKDLGAKSNVIDNLAALGIER